MSSTDIVLGLGVTGQAVAEFLLAQGRQVIGIEKKPSEALNSLKEKGLKVVAEADPALIQPGVILHLSPGIPSTHPLVQAAEARGIAVLSEIELAFQNTRRPLIGITGTNGKTTTTLLTTHVLNACGLKAEALGNVGTPLISRVNGEGIGVVELSSYQLERISTPALLGGALLNITPDHLDRYHTMQAYAEAKFRMKEILKPKAPFIIHQQTAREWAGWVPPDAIIYGSAGQSHDEENMQAAFLLTHIFGITEVAFQEAIKSFQKPPHRIEWVREINGAHFWNDSKGTNIDATMRAVEAMKGPVVLIAGGVDKGHPYTMWRPLFKEKVKEVIVLGEAKDKIEKDLQGVVPLCRAATLQEAVKIAFEGAEKGDQVLLSPGCSSFDMFRDYEDRGEQFKSLVRSLS